MNLLELLLVLQVTRLFCGVLWRALLHDRRWGFGVGCCLFILLVRIQGYCAGYEGLLVVVLFGGFGSGVLVVLEVLMLSAGRLWVDWWLLIWWVNLRWVWEFSLDNYDLFAGWVASLSLVGLGRWGMCWPCQSVVVCCSGWGDVITHLLIYFILLIYTYWLIKNFVY